MFPEISIKRVRPCDTKAAPLTQRRLHQLFSGLRKGWRLTLDHKLHGEFEFPDFMEAMVFVNDVAAIAEEAQRFPEIRVAGSEVAVVLHSPDISALSEEDFEMAQLIERLV